MIKLARKLDSDGFLYQPNLRYGYLLTATYDRSCQSPVSQSWPLYLSRIPYSKMSFGFNRCPTSFGPLRTGINEDQIAREANDNGADGYTYQSSLRYGRVLTKPYDRSCRSPASQSWPLFLKTITYELMQYGFNGCPIELSRTFRDVSREYIENMANEAGSDGYTYQPTLRYGAILTKPYDRQCRSPSSESWPLYLSTFP